MRALVVFLLLTGVAHAQIKPPVDADAPQITTTPGKAKVSLAEPFQVFITVLHKPEMTVTLPAQLDLGAMWTELGARNESHTVETDGTIRRSFVLTVGSLETGTINFPGLTLGYEVKGEPRTIQTSGFTVEVVSGLAEGAKEELRPVASPVVVTQPDYTVAWAAGGVVAAGVLASALYLAVQRARRRRKEARTPSLHAILLPPVEHALSRLRALAESGRLDQPVLYPVYFEISEILRQYVGARWGFDALEQTSAELLESLRARAPEITDELGGFLAELDMVKFARVPVDRAGAEAAIAQAVAFVDKTRPPVVQAPS
jgi:hypothetical protein